MASARLLGVTLLPGEARSAKHRLHPSLLGKGVSLLEQWRSVAPVASSDIQRKEGREVTVASLFSSGEKRPTPPWSPYSWWRTSHLTFSFLRRKDHDPPPSSSWKGTSSCGVEGCTGFEKGRRKGFGHGICPPPWGHSTSRGSKE